MKRLVSDLHMVNRSLAGPGFTSALDRISQEIPLETHLFESGSDAWTWRIPNEWDVREAHIDAPIRIADFDIHPLHVWSYSLPYQGRVSRDELLRHIVTDPARPDVIPFTYRYYDRDWGFSLADSSRCYLASHAYDVVIDTIEEPGYLRVGEYVVPGGSEESILVVAHLCHPGQANDDLAGVSVAVEVAKRLRPGRFTVRFLFVPEQIGTVAYLSRHEQLIPGFRAGVFLEMLGTDYPLMLQHSRRGGAIDRAAMLALHEAGGDYQEADFGAYVVNDELVLDGPGVDVPTISLSRIRRNREMPFPEYHSSADTPEIVSEERLREAADVVERTLHILDTDLVPRRMFRGTPHLSRHGLWPDAVPLIHHLEGDETAAQIALQTGLPFETVTGCLERLAEVGLVDLAAPKPDGERVYKSVKPWGEETVFAKNGAFTKVLRIDAGECTSLHYHNFDKVMMALDQPHGGILIDGRLIYGTDPVPVPRGTVHREYGPQRLVEIGVGDPADVHRLDDKYGRA